MSACVVTFTRACYLPLWQCNGKMKDEDNAMGFERSPSASGPEALSLSQFSNANTHRFLRARTHTWHRGESFKCYYLSLHIFIWPYRAERALSRNYTALGEAGKVAETALLSAFARSVVSLTDAVYCSQQNQ